MISMRSGISKYLLVILLGLCNLPICAQQDSERYDRPSLCMMMVARQEMAYGNEIEEVFKQMEMPERFNDHSLGVRVFKVPQDGKPIIDAIVSFEEQAEVAKKMISKWFGRDKETGCFNTSLIQERGLYNATQQDWNVAMRTIRGKVLLADAGEKLIGKTFLVVNEFKYKKRYSTKNDTSNSNENTISELNLSNQEDIDAYNERLHGGDKLLSELNISCTSYLFQLDWTEETAATFYSTYYFPCNAIESQKIQPFKRDKETFHLTYLGMCSDKLTERNTHKLTTSKFVKKACVRITDKNIASLQHQFPQFRIKARLLSSGEDGKVFKAYIGLKEDITPASRFEVLEPELHEDGTYSYKRKGIIQPILGKIWDNRYMATDDVESDLDATYFKQVSGGELSPGLLIREL